MKVAICLPTTGTVHAAFTLSLANMLLATSGFRGMPVSIRIFMEPGGLSDLAQQREHLLNGADQWGADKALWIDSDQTFPPDTLIRLVTRQVPVIGANIVRRQEPTFPTAARLDDERAFLFTTREKADAPDPMEEVSRIGLGLTMVDMSFVRKAERPWFEFGRDPDGGRVSEDQWFCRRLKAAGARIYVDHALSWKVGHLYTKPLYNADAFGMPKRS